MRWRPQHLAAAVLLGLGACQSEPPPPPLVAEVVPEAAPEATPAPAAPPEVGPIEAPAPLDKGAPSKIKARHIVVAWADCKGAGPEIRRTRAEAYARIQAVGQALDEGKPFEAVASEASDGPSGARGGELGVFEQGVMHPAFEAAAFGLAVGERSGVVETPFGFHLIERQEWEAVRITHVVVQWEGAERSEQTRTKEEALARATEAHLRLSAGEDPALVAQTFSDGALGRRGGDLGFVVRKQTPPAFEDEAFSLRRGEISDVLETPVGFHVLLRTE